MLLLATPRPPGHHTISYGAVYYGVGEGVVGGMFGWDRVLGGEQGCSQFIATIVNKSEMDMLLQMMEVTELLRRSKSDRPRSPVWLAFLATYSASHTKKSNQIREDSRYYEQRNGFVSEPYTDHAHHFFVSVIMLSKYEECNGKNAQ